MHDFQIRSLSLTEVRALYHKRLAVDFPPDELKPLSAIERALSRDAYLCYGAVKGNDILAYAFFVKAFDNQVPCALFDYLAVQESLRDTGIGSRFLQGLIAGPLRGFGVVLLEVDDPAYAKSPNDLDTRNRRLDFYLRNGLRDTQVTATVYRVEYRILALPVAAVPGKEDTRRIYSQLYRVIFPPSVFEAMFLLT